MINHVVLFKLKKFPEKKKVEVLSELKTALESLKGKIQEVKFLEVGLNHKTETEDYDIVLLSHFETIAALDVYRTHPEHLKVVALFADVVESRAAVDYKF
jgi:hypothetical protein